MNFAKMTPSAPVRPSQGSLMYGIYLHSDKVSALSEIVAYEMTKLSLSVKLILEQNLTILTQT